ncbi:hypothetical protein [Hymenobacter latericus]|uniref:hypothetical protein n=1 Tax=Hymenobacter sp. YIM 151858-1 TaxID=2987688 RepID=UPI00222638B3|nr:hypothetical protein [Hymenobacter sp. YIM 151858-1]UYZ61144.1 hypothetical protein OIS50_19435 [Hymenobacter sp. YIM 151858-1]
MHTETVVKQSAALGDLQQALLDQDLIRAAQQLAVMVQQRGSRCALTLAQQGQLFRYCYELINLKPDASPRQLLRWGSRILDELSQSGLGKAVVD